MGKVRFFLHLGQIQICRLRCKVRPDFCKVGFRRVRETKGQGLANNFLPRAILFLGSKSVTRPAARSATRHVS